MMNIGHGACGILLLGLTLACEFSVALVHAQAAAPAIRIGWLSSGTASPGDTDSNFDALRTGLAELGYVEGRSVAFAKRWAAGDRARLPVLAAELVHLKVNLICTAGTPASMAAKEATTAIPIVFGTVAFPDESGLVASYAHPGGNITGVAFVGPEYGKRLELLKAAVPKLQRVALIYNSENRAKSLRVVIDPHSVRGPRDLNNTFEAIARSRPEALMTTADTFILSSRIPIVEFATRAKLPSMFPDREYVEIGGLMFYGGSITDMYRQAAIYVDRILKGAKPASMPVEQPRKFDMVINLKVARALGLKMPQSLLLRADSLMTD